MFGLLSKVTDPVCKMSLDKKKAKFSSEQGGETYYFCSQDCSDKFKDNPQEKFEKKGKAGCSCC